MNIIENKSLRDYTTLKVGGPARYIIRIDNADELYDGLIFADQQRMQTFILGGGSNLIVNDSGYDGVILQIASKGINVIEETDDYITLNVASGEKWDAVVQFAVDHNLWGIENLSIIPGSTGALAVQNVGCYGQEASEVIQGLVVYDSIEKKLKRMSNQQCDFHYRASIFSTVALGRYVILETIIQLQKKRNPVLSYPDVIKYFKNAQISNPSLTQIRQAIISIRQKKFADTAKIGTTGSTFKNLMMTDESYKQMKTFISKKYSHEIVEKLDQIKFTFSDSECIKFPTAFLIDKLCRLKEIRRGGAQVSPTHALAIINPDFKATAADIIELIKYVRQAVYEAAGVKVSIEPQLVGFSKQETESLYALT